MKSSSVEKASVAHSAGMPPAALRAAPLRERVTCPADSARHTSNSPATILVSDLCISSPFGDCPLTDLWRAERATVHLPSRSAREIRSASTREPNGDIQLSDWDVGQNAGQDEVQMKQKQRRDEWVRVTKRRWGSWQISLRF